MLLTSPGVVKLCDFGLIASIQSAQTEEQSDMTGTPHYMSPGYFPYLFPSLPLILTTSDDDFQSLRMGQVTTLGLTFGHLEYV
jgi:serine/threonine protein kinase